MLTFDWFLWATLASIEEYGAVMSLGGAHVGFVHRRHWANDVAPPRLRPVLFAGTWREESC